VTVLPIAPLTMPSTLLGQANGKLEANLMKETTEVSGVLLEVTAARSFDALFAAAKAAGFNPRGWGGYRSYDRQLNLFLERYRECSETEYYLMPTEHRKYWADAVTLGYGSPWWIKKKRPGGGFPATAATPGTSNHGWGLAVDIAEQLDADSEYESISRGFVDWLVANASRFGISAELQSEPWHWRYVAGDSVPEATLQYEGFNGSSNVEVDMIVLDYRKGTPGWVALVTTGTEVAHIVNGDADRVFTDAKVVRVPVSKDSLEGLLVAFRKVGASPFAGSHPWSDAELDALWRS
jgi:LAS superfamily LD-carboxypeptidase LdcB